MIPSDAGREDAWAEAEDLSRLKADVLRYLRVRERTVQEVKTYLRRRGHDVQPVAAVLAELQAQGLVSDRRFADLFLRDRRRLHPMSRAAVLRELKRRGVSESVAREALAASDPPWDDEQLAAEALARRWSRWRPEKRREQARRFLQRRGFSVGVTGRVVARRVAMAEEADPAGVPSAEEWAKE